VDSVDGVSQELIRIYLRIGVANGITLTRPCAFDKR